MGLHQGAVTTDLTHLVSLAHLVDWLLAHGGVLYAIDSDS